MIPNALTRDGFRRSPARAVRRNGLLQLGFPHFLLLTGLLGGLLGLVWFVFVIHLSSL